jgi:hypothetical protein
MLTECAWAASRMQGCFLKEKYWQIQSKSHKKGTAVRALSHTLLQLFYKVLTTGERYQERGQAPLDERTRERLVRHHVRRLGKLGICCSISPAPGGKRSSAKAKKGETPKEGTKRRQCGKTKITKQTQSRKRTPTAA